MLDVAHLVGDDRLELALVEPLQQAARHPDVGAAPGAPEGEGVWGGVVDEPQGDQRDASLPAAGGDDPTQRQPGGVAVPVMGDHLGRHQRADQLGADRVLHQHQAQRDGNRDPDREVEQHDRGDPDRHHQPEHEGQRRQRSAQDEAHGDEPLGVLDR